MLKDEKPKLVEELKKLINTYSVIGLLNMHSLPAKQLQKIKTDLKGVATIKMSKKSLIKKALEGSEKNVNVLEERIVGEPAMIFSNEDPFRLFKILKENISSAPARLGNVAPHDIIIPKGPTGLPPGPAISTLQKVGLKTTVDKGKIAVADDKVVVKAGETVKEDAVNALNLLKIEPMEIGLDLISAWQDEKIYDKSVLDIDTDEYINNIGLAVQQMIDISLNTGYLVPETAKMALQKAFIEAKELALTANILDKDIIGELLLKAISEAKALDALVPEAKEEKKSEEKPTKENNSSDKKEVEK
jgi:large subunit ribosomal protein L10